jgi:hypothetical protein
MNTAAAKLHVNTEQKAEVTIVLHCKVREHGIHEIGRLLVVERLQSSAEREQRVTTKAR